MSGGFFKASVGSEDALISAHGEGNCILLLGSGMEDEVLMFWWGGPGLGIRFFVKEPRGRPRGLGEAVELRVFSVGGGRREGAVDFIGSVAGSGSA